MEKQRQIKILSIVALVLAISAMTLGFAAFSTTLSISSSATVTPSASDFKMKVYGMVDIDSVKYFMSNSSSLDISKLNLSESIGVADNGSFNSVSINNESFTVSNINLQIDNSFSYVNYVFLIKNEGKYDTYYRTMYGNSVMSSDYVGTCVADDGELGTLGQAMCDNISINLLPLNYDVNGNMIGSISGKIGISEYMALQITVSTRDSSIHSDEPFTISFEDIKLDFSTTNFN